MTCAKTELLSRLERAERRSRVSMAVCVGVLCVVGLMGMRSADTESAPGAFGRAEFEGIAVRNGVITARGIIVQDSSGMPRIEMGADPDTQRQAALFGLLIRDAAGAERLGVGVDAGNRVVLGMDAAPGVGSPMRDRLALIVGADGSASVSLIDNVTTVPVELFSLADGGGGIRFHEFDRQARTLRSREVTFGGDGEEKVRKLGGE